MIDPLVEERQRDIPYVQPTQGMGITIKCKDPVGAIKFLDYLIKEDTQRLLQWGILGEHYEVDENASTIARLNSSNSLEILTGFRTSLSALLLQRLPEPGGA